jgi:ribosomal protein S6--L-glutamate ligase
MSTHYQPIIILSHSATSPGVASLEHAAKKLDISIRVISPTDTNAPDILLAHSLAIIRFGPISYPLYLDLLQRCHGEARRHIQAVLHAFDKIQTYAILSGAHIPIPRSWVMTAGDACQEYPFVIKVAAGNQGRGVELIHDEGELHKYFEDFSDQNTFIAQEFIHEAKSSDKRLFVVGQTVVAAMKRTSVSDDFRANLHQGARGELYVPTDQEIAIAQQTIKAFRLEYGGVDIIDSDRGPLVLEVNPSPGFGISDITGIDAAEELLKYKLGTT